MSKAIVRGLVFLWLAAGAATIQAQISQVPLIVAGSAVPPNLVYTFDDSNSMFLECHNDDLCASGGTDGSNTRRVGSVPYGIPSAGGLKSSVATYDLTRIFNYRMRSPQVNRLYYDPAIRYRPWLRADLTRYPQYLPSAAAVDPRVTPSPLLPNSSVNLTVSATLSDINVVGSAGFCPASSGNGGSGSSDCDSMQTVYIPQYFTLRSGADPSVISSYTRTVIAGVGTTYPKGSERADCLGSTCSFTEEMQNFANWFTYYRSRIHTAIGGTAEAFQYLPASYRLGYASINGPSNNLDGVTTNTLVRGVRPFTGSSRNDFYTWLFALNANGLSPLRRAVGDVGEYFRREDNRGPWGSTPGTNDTTPHLGCRRAYHILTTDGVWDNNSPAINNAATGNVDNTTGPSVSGPNGQTYLNTASRPYSDRYSGTLADVASYYWKNDLRPSTLANLVPSSPVNPAFWQHMVNYTLAFGLSGNLNNPADLPRLVAGTVEWSNTNTDPGKVDDLWHAAINSRGRYFNASNPTAFSDSLRAIIGDIDDREGSEAGVAVSGRQLTGNTRKYVPEYRTGFWSGKLSAIPLDLNAEGDTPLWQAADSIPAPADRRIYTYINTSLPAVTFTWAALDAQGVSGLLNVTPLQGPGLVAYLRGDRTGEGVTYRLRAGVLGDIVNSTPLFVRNLVDMQYDFLPNGTPGRNNYREFLNRKSRRIAQIFVGANDGMFHVFSDVGGTETFAFVPRAVLGEVRQLASLSYNHRYFVDGPALETDVYSSSANDWRNVVISSGGAGAKNLFAINAPTPSAAAAAGTSTAQLYPPGPSDILWERSSGDSDYSELGYVLQTPEAGLMRDGSWVVITGNGYESTSGKAQLFIINALTGALIKRIDTFVGSTAAGNRNGLGGVRVVRDAQQRIVSAYAGDLLGNLWKFDLSGNTTSSWNVAFGSTAASPQPLYRAVNRQGQVEPITAAPNFVLHPLGGVMVLAGTGKLFEGSDPSDLQERTLYGLWDKISIGADSSSNSTTTGPISGTVSLVLQTVTNTITVVVDGESLSYYGISSNTVDYATSRGWRLPQTIQAGQRLVYDPQIALGRVFYETLVPGGVATSCMASNVGTAYNFVIDPLTGAAGTDGATFDTNNDGVIDGADNPQAAAYKSTADGSDAILLKQNSQGGFTVSSGNSKQFAGNKSSIRRSWRHIVNPPFLGR